MATGHQLKTALCDRWTSEHCRNVSMIMKMDDDVLINYNRMSLLQYLIDRMSMYKYPVYAGKATLSSAVFSLRPSDLE